MSWLTSMVVFVLSVSLAATESSQPATQHGVVDPLPALPPSELGASTPLLSSAYMTHPNAICLVLFRQEIPWVLSLALANAGKSSAARMAMMAIDRKSKRLNSSHLG